MKPLPSLCVVFLSGILGAIGAPPENAVTSTAAPLVITAGYGVDGLVLWLGADRGVTIDVHSRVVSLVDGTGNFTLTSPGTDQGPLFVPNGLNGKPVFRFDRSRSLYSPDNFGTELNRDMTIVMVAMSSGTVDYDQFSIYLGQNTTPHANRAFAYHSGFELFDGQFVACYGMPMVKGAFVMTTASINASLTQSTFYRNGQQTVVSDLAKENGDATFANLSDGVTFGAATDPVCGWNGDIAEVLVYDRQLSPREVQTIWSALSNKYGLKQAVAVASSASSVSSTKH